MNRPKTNRELAEPAPRLGCRARLARSSAVAGFTLVELILVMLVMATIMALAAPMLSRSLRDRHLEQEGLRLLAMTEQARSTAISEGVPILFYVDTTQGRYGMEPKEGFETNGVATRDYALGQDVSFDSVRNGTGSVNGESTAEFAPDGMMEESSFDSVRLADRFGNTLLLARTDDGWSFEIVKENP